MKYAIALLLIYNAFAVAGNTGKMAGKVVDATTKEGLAGVNISIQGTMLGASTNLDGEFTILNIPPNSYSLRASMVGYDPVTVTGLQVSIDLTTRQDFALTESAVEQKEVVITGSQPVVRKDLTATTAVIGKDQIAALPVTEVTQILNLKAGYVSGSLRGGRKGEVAYWVDGVPVTDVYDGGQVVEVNKNLVEELQLVSGAFNAEYGQALSGIVNVATKEGGQKLTGSVGVYGGQYATSADKRYVTRVTDGSIDSSELFPGLNTFTPTAIRNIEGYLSGPLGSEHLTFFANGRYIYFDGWEKGFRRFNPQNVPYIDAAGFGHLYSPNGGQGDSAVIPMNSSERKYGQGKLTWHLSSLMKLSADYLYENTVSQPYDRAYFYDPDGKGKNYDVSNTLIFQWTHSLSSNTFYTIGASVFNKDFQYHLYDDPHDPRYVDPALTIPITIYSFNTGGTDLSRFHRTTTTALAKLDLSSQVNQTHLLKGGIEYRHHRVFRENITLVPALDQTGAVFPYIRTDIPSDTGLFHDVYTHRPTEFSAYLQDKMEFKNFIMNLGVRFDYFEPDGLVLNDDQTLDAAGIATHYTVDDPEIYDPIKPWNQNKTLQQRLSYWYRKAKPKWQLSPRIGASFPITAEGVVHFSYGYFFQVPRFERLYENPDFKLGKGTGNQGVVGNSDLEPEQTINGEIGVQQQISEGVSVDLTAYMRDIRNLTGSGINDEIVVFRGAKKYSRYVNKDFGTVKGIVLTLNRRFSGGLSSTVDYTYQIARGSSSDPTQTRNAILGGQLPEVQLVPLDWDQRHTLNVTASYDSHPWGVSLIGQYGSGSPYTPFSTVDISTLLTNSQIKPAFFNLDARAYYEFNLTALKIVAFARVFNLLNIRNQVGVFDRTGRADFTTQEQQVEATNAPQFVNTYDQWFRRADFYSEPRRIEVGMNVEF